MSQRSPDVLLRVLLAVSPSDGRVRMTHARGQPDHLLGHLAAAHGVSFFFIHDSRWGYPVLSEARLGTRASRR